jgi:hypothetical protein
MAHFGSLIDKTFKAREPQVPSARLERVNPPVTNRLDEWGAELFDYACSAGELESAAELLALLEKWHARRDHADEQHRKTGAIRLKRMTGELERRHIMKGIRPTVR